MGNKTAKYIWAVLNFVAVVWLALGGVGGRAFGQTLIGKTVRLNDGTDNVYSVFGEQDIKERVNVKNYADGNTSDSLVWSGVGTDFYLRKNRRGNLITVAKSGGDFDDIHDAVAASSAGDVILVFPGTYTVSSSININKNITVAGVDRKACIIEREHASSAEVAYDDGVFLFSAGLPDGARLANLTIKNTGNSTGTYATPAVIATDGNNHIQNCYIGGNGGSDILCFLGSSVVSCDMVTVEQYKYLSNASPIIRARGSAFLTFEHGEVLTRGAGGGTQLNTTSDAAFRWTDFHNTEGIDVVKCDTLTLFGCRKDAAPFLISNNYTALNVNSCDYMDAFVNYGNLSLNSDSDIGGKKLFKMHWYDNPDNYYFKIDPIDGLYWGEGDNENYDTRLFRSANTLKTDGAFDANSLKIGGTEVISSARALSNVSIGGGLIDSGTVADARLSSNVPLKNGANTFTNFQTISANATSDMLTVSGGNMSDGKSALRVSGAFPNSAGAYNSMADFKATSGGSDKNEYALNSELLAGGTSAVISAAGRFINARSGTGGAFGTVSGAVGNLGVYAQSGATTAGYNYGGIFDARGGAVNVGVEGLAITNKASAVNVGVFGNASNTAEGGVQVGGLFGLNRTTPPASSAALICDNGNTGKDVFLAKVNGANKVKIDLNGNVELEDGINVKGEIKQNGVVAIRMDGCRYFTMPDANKKANGDIISLNDFTHNFGELVYLASDGKAYKADASSTATLPAVAMVADDSAQGYFLLRGYIRNDDWDTLTIGKEVWASTTAGGITQVKPTGAGESVQSVGFAVGAKTIFFDPQRVIITLGGEE